MQVQEQNCHLSVERLHAAAVDEKHLAADPFGDRSGEVEYGARDVGRFTEAVNRRVGQHAALDLGRQHRRKGPRARGARPDAVDAHVHRPEVECQIGCHVVERRFRRSVGAHVRAFVDTGHRSDIDDAAVTRPGHVGHHEFAEFPRAEDIETKNRLELLGAEFERIFVTAPTAAGVVHEDVYRPELLDGALDQMLQRPVVEYVACNGEGLASLVADSLGHGFAGFGRAVAYHDGGSRLGKRFAAGAADAVAAAGDDGHLARKIE